MPERQSIYVMLIKATADALRSPSLADWIEEIEKDYMSRFSGFSSLAHVAIEQGPWNFVLVFPGTEGSVKYLSDQISSRAPGQTELLTMRGSDLDEYVERLKR